MVYYTHVIGKIPLAKERKQVLIYLIYLVC